MKTARVFQIGFFLIYTLAAQACLNKYGTKVDGTPMRGKYGRWTYQSMTNAPGADHWRGQADALYKYAMEPDATFQTKSDYAVALLHLGQAKEAIQILEPLNAARPEEYNLAANLGTAYELNGENEKALQTLRKATEMNPASHEGTEWLHLKILEAKIALEKNPRWLESHSVLGVSFGTDLKPVAPVDAPKLKEFSDAISYQLHERLQFVRPPDPVVADLFFDYGNILALMDVVESVPPFYTASLSFGDLRKPLIEARSVYFDRLSHRFSLTKAMRGAEKNPVVWILFVGATAVGGMVMRNLRQRRASQIPSNFRMD